MSQRKKCEHCKTKNKLANNDFSLQYLIYVSLYEKKEKNCVEPKIDVVFFGFFFAGELLGSHLQQRHPV